MSWYVSDQVLSNTVCDCLCKRRGVHLTLHIRHICEAWRVHACHTEHTSTYSATHCNTEIPRHDMCMRVTHMRGCNIHCNTLQHRNTEAWLVHAGHTYSTYARHNSFMCVTCMYMHMCIYKQTHAAARATRARHIMWHVVARATRLQHFACLPRICCESEMVEFYSALLPRHGDMYV